MKREFRRGGGGVCMGFGFQGNVDRELHCQTVPLLSRDNKIVLTS